jgi:hypothetical protein
LVPASFTKTTIKVATDVRSRRVDERNHHGGL